jgi:hypothetical protein
VELKMAEKKLSEPVQMRETSMYEEVMSVDGARYNNYRHDAYRFAGGKVVIKDKRDPYSDKEELDVIWRE